MKYALALVLLAACGEVDATLPDAGPPRDGTGTGADGAPDAAPAPVSVTVWTDDGTELPVPGATVVFVDADGTVTRTTTDSAGVVTALVGPGSSVTVVRLSPGGGAELTTTLGVMPGDQLRYGRRANRFDYGPTLSSTPLGWGPPPGSSAYQQVFTGCGSAFVIGGTTTATLDVGARCGTSARDLILVSYDTNGLPAWFQHEPNFTPGAPYTFAGPWQSSVSGTVGLVNLPTNVSSGNGRLDQVVRGIPASNTYYGVTTGGPTAAATFTLPNLPASQLAHNFRLYRDSFGQVEILTTTGFSTQLSLDVGAAMLPWLIQPTLDPATRRLAWTAEGPGQPDMIVLDASYYRAQSFYRWTVFAPGTLGVTNLQLPDLPPEVGDLEPQAGDTGNGNVRYFRFVGGNWDSVRGEADLQVDPYNFDFSSQPDLTQITASGFILKG